ncbi:6-phospho-beta-glucosidase [Suilimivivens aceti]|uniref:6-phospho-beta-glucosidase n=2 Tax=Lachnospiraceae TaxID=186803 RepID=A0ABT2T3F3_9FIRM|nr:6-phospho-beta-glucosidase [Suilimivivens aceti]MCU6744782.1 6-phospho-beta-glucosidase [Suilimivivens aceti]
MKTMKIAVIGGGSSYTPELMEGIINHKDSLPVTEVVLIDIPEGQEKVSINTAFAKRMAEKAGLPISVRYTLDRREGLKDASFVIAQIRVGGLDAREKDERIPLKYDVIGQETTGPGGFFKALRTIPVMLSICRDMEEVCKDAWLINFTNPSGIITEAILKNTKVKCIGLCNVSINMRYDAAERLSVSPDELDCRFIGLNHLSVMNHAYYQGKDRILDAVSVENTESVVKNIQKDAEMDAVAKELGCLLSPYMQYFYTEKEALQHEKMEAIGLTGTRAAQVKEVEKNLFECYKDINLREKPAALAKRGGARYSMAAICLIDSIYNDTNDVQVVDVFNNGIIPQLPDDVVIEVNCRIGRNGAAPLASDVPASVLGLIGQVKAYEEYTIEAAITGDRNKALIALLNNPLIHDVRDAKGILNELLEAHRAYLPAFFQ